jgi:hypothetical protein
MLQGYEVLLYSQCNTLVARSARFWRHGVPKSITQHQPPCKNTTGHVADLSSEATQGSRMQPLQKQCSSKTLTAT